jgi:hypothetical protein
VRNTEQVRLGELHTGTGIAIVIEHFDPGLRGSRRVLQPRRERAATAG